jgi:hypothetical protein
MTAHVAGVPFEELLVPLLSSGGVLVLAARSALRAPRRRGRRNEPGAAEDVAVAAGD